MVLQPLSHKNHNKAHCLDALSDYGIKFLDLYNLSKIKTEIQCQTYSARLYLTISIYLLKQALCEFLTEGPWEQIY